ncbi:TorF family putative porin [Caulobacter endophyticus]|uniref:Porin n=1 Tax=Caulobacter endophyticus TaxID=2172652 RepID=A0A2T9JMF6_9CAUL|nr:TorF family putative porin [Caulobacter endophyticus]PVM84897.1 hypothetical protein DDF67_18540 [Caulobacter endophyticus]
MKFFKLALAAATASVALGGAAMAQEVSLSYNVGIASDYVFRGVSQTNEDPQVFGGVDLGYGIGYAGVWASNVDFGADDPSVEIDFYAGVKPTVGTTSFDFAVLYYGYSKDKGLTPGKYSYTELKAAVVQPIGKATVGGALYYSPKYTGDVGSSLYYEVNASYPLNDKLSLSGALGKQDYEDTDGYATWNVGATYAITGNLGLDLRYWDTAEHGWGDIYKSRVAATLKATF